MSDFQELLEMSKEMVFSYYDPSDLFALIDVSQALLCAAKDCESMSLEKMLQISADQIVLGIFPYVEVTEDGEKFFSTFDSNESLPAWTEVKENGFFLIDPNEADFVRSLKDVDEEMAVRILCATGVIRVGLKDEIAQQEKLKEAYSE